MGFFIDDSHLDSRIQSTKLKDVDGEYNSCIIVISFFKYKYPFNTLYKLINYDLIIKRSQTDTFQKREYQILYSINK